ERGLQEGHRKGPRGHRFLPLAGVAGLRRRPQTRLRRSSRHLEPRLGPGTGPRRGNPDRKRRAVRLAGRERERVRLGEPGLGQTELLRTLALGIRSRTQGHEGRLSLPNLCSAGTSALLEPSPTTACNRFAIARGVVLGGTEER